MTWSAAARSLRRKPRLLVLSLLLLSIGIGLPTAMYSVLRGVLLRGLPFPDGDRIVALSTDARGAEWGMARDDFEAVRDRLTTLDRVAAYSTVNFFATFEAPARSDERTATGRRSGAPLAGAKGTVRVVGSYVGGDFFPLLGVEPLLGRWIQTSDLEPGAPPTVAISHRFWRRHFDADPRAIGSQLLVNRRSMTIVGVLPPDFHFPYRHDLWAALSSMPASGASFPVFVAGRLADGQGLAGARAELAALVERLETERLRPGPRGERAAQIAPYVEALTSPDTERSLRLLLWASVGVLVVASANLGNLRLSELLDRRRELAVRAALGAGRWTLVRGLLLESVLLWLAGAVAGLAVAALLLRATERMLLSSSWLVGFWISIDIDASALAAALVVSALALGVGGLLPAVWTTRGGFLGEAEARSASGERTSPLVRAFVVAEVAVCFALVLASGLLVKSARGLLGADVGFDGTGLHTTLVSLYQGDYDDPSSRAEFFRRLEEALESRPEIESAAIASAPPWGYAPSRAIAAGGEAVASSMDDLPTALVRDVGVGALETIGLPLLQGRRLGETDASASSPAPIVIGESLAEKQFGSVPSALGRRLRIAEGAEAGLPEDDEAALVVGVVGDVDLRPPGSPIEPSSVLYRLFPSGPPHGATLLLRSRHEEARISQWTTEEVRRIDPLAVVFEPASFETAWRRQNWVERQLESWFSMFAIVALVLTCAGLYGVVSLLVRRRRSELAVRLVVGARPTDLGRLVLFESSRSLVLGLALGGLSGVVLIRVIGRYLHGVRLWDPPTLAIAVGALAVTYFLASFGPVRRATATDPIEALKAE